jgi:hypothetical protein
MKKIAILFFMGTVFLSACSTSRWIQSPVVKESQLSVIIEHRMEDDSVIKQNYDHPYDIDLPTLEKFLTELMYTEEVGLFNNGTEKPVFQPDELERLAPALVEAMAKASPDQRIFFTSSNRGKALLFETTRKTEGIIFIEPKNKLNIAFGLINFDVEPNDINEMADSLSRIEPLTLQSSGTPLVPSLSYAKHYTLENGEQLPMSMTADIGKLRASLAAEPKQPVLQKTEPEFSKTSVTEAKKTSAPPAVSQPEIDQKQRIKKDLGYLKELFDEGLISKEEYETKKKEVLDSIKY